MVSRTQRVMATKRYAKAIVDSTNIVFDEWMETLRNQHEGAVPKDVIYRTAKTVLRKCDPKQYLLSHATIVASVDCYTPKGVKTGTGLNRGVQTNVKWTDFRIDPECQYLINNNGDAWERSLLLSTYRTFIGAHNYLEHIQLPELSKGYIVDAIARDLGKTCYIDILVATDRKHTQLVSDILTGKITGLSMGCISLFTTCTKCGNVAADDSQTCPCIQYEGKRSTFVDQDGIEHKLAELIGHVSIPNSNQFIEASWVGNPAFGGAVRRNILNPDPVQLASQLSQAESINMSRNSIPEIGNKKVAFSKIAQGEQDKIMDDETDTSDTSDESQDVSSEQSDQDYESKDTSPERDSSIGEKADKLVDNVVNDVLDNLSQKVEEKMAPDSDEVGVVTAPVDLEQSNDNLVRSSDEFIRRLHRNFSNPRLIKWASQAWKIVHIGGIEAIHRARLSSKDLIILSWIEDRCRGKEYNPNLYKTAMSVGPISNYPSKTSYLATCKVRLGRDLSDSEKSFLVWKGKIAAVSKF